MTYSLVLKRYLFKETPLPARICKPVPQVLQITAISNPKRISQS